MRATTIALAGLVLLTAESVRADESREARLQRRADAIRLDPAFTKVSFVTETVRAPWAVFVALPETAEAREAATRRGRAVAASLGEVFSTWQREVAPRLEAGLGRAAPDLSDEILDVVVFPDREAWDAYWKILGQRMPPGLDRLYQVSAGRLIAAPPKEADAGFDFDLRRLGGHVLLVETARRLRGEGLVDRMAAARTKPLWLRDGMASLLAVLSAPDDRLLATRLEKERAHRAAERAEWALEDLLRAESRVAVGRGATERAGKTPDARTAYRERFYVRSLWLSHWLWQGDDGKRRPALLRTLAAELAGESGITAVRNHLAEFTTEEGRSRIEKALEAHVARLLE